MAINDSAPNDMGRSDHLVDIDPKGGEEKLCWSLGTIGELGTWDLVGTDNCAGAPSFPQCSSTLSFRWSKAARRRLLFEATHG